MGLLNKLKKAFIPPDEKAAFEPPAGAARSRVWMDVAIGGAPAGRIEMELFDEAVPKTTANFRALCAGHEYEGESGGDLVRGDGTGTFSIYGGPFPDEAFAFAHTIPGLLSMANSGPGTNGCQFFITAAPADFLDGKHVVFGRVVEGMGVVRAIERTPTGANDRPVAQVVITACGVAGAGAGAEAGAGAAGGAAAAAGAVPHAAEAGAAHAAGPGPSQDELGSTQAIGGDPSSATGTSAAPGPHTGAGHASGSGPP